MAPLTNVGSRTVRSPCATGEYRGCHDHTGATPMPCTKAESRNPRKKSLLGSRSNDDENADGERPKDSSPKSRSGTGDGSSESIPKLVTMTW